MYIDYQKCELDNGLTIIGSHRDTHSAALAIRIKSGSLSDENGKKGLAHAFEHMLFKGTDARSTPQIYADLDKLGTSFNAHTGHECIVLNGYLPAKNFIGVCDVFTDMIFNSQFLSETWAVEMPTIIEEIKGNNDDIFNYTSNKLMHCVFQGKTPNKTSPLAYPILGYQSDVELLSPDDFKKFWANHCVPENIVISVVGNICFNEVVDYFSKHDQWSKEVLSNKDEMLLSSHMAPKHFIEEHFIKEGQQQSCMQLFIPNKGLAHSLIELSAINVLTAILGNGMNSRYFQKIREDNGYAYAVGATNRLFSNIGGFLFYCLYSQDNEDAIVDIVNEEIALVSDCGVEEEELLTKKNNAVDKLLMSTEHNKILAMLLAKAASRNREHLLNDGIEVIQSLQNEDIINVAKNYFTGNNTIDGIQRGVFCFVNPPKP